MNNKIYVTVNDNVFVKEVKQDMMKGVMYVPDSLDNDFVYGEVISVSDGYFDKGTFIPSVVAHGDMIAFPKISGSKITINGHNLIMVKQSDIIAKQIEGTLNLD